MPILSMGKLVLESIFRKPVTVDFPKAPKETGERFRGMIENEIDKCIFCGICQRKCPTGAIEVKRAEKVWSIERFLCVQCGCCTEVCPKKCLTLEGVLPSAETSMGKDVYELARVSDDTEDHPDRAGARREA